MTPPSGKAEQKELECRFVFRQKTVGARQMVEFVEQHLGPGLMRGEKIIQMFSNYTDSKRRPQS